MTSKKIPFDFILDELSTAHPVVRPMFGAYGIYVNDKIVLITRFKDSHPNDNGVWLATTTEHHESLKKELPNMRSLELFGTKGPTGWQNLPMNSKDFETSVMHACALILKNDPRIGKVSARKKKKLSGELAKKGSRSKRPVSAKRVGFLKPKSAKAGR